MYHLSPFISRRCCQTNVLMIGYRAGFRTTSRRSLNDRPNDPPYLSSFYAVEMLRLFLLCSMIPLYNKVSSSLPLFAGGLKVLGRLRKRTMSIAL